VGGQDMPVITRIQQIMVNVNIRHQEVWLILFFKFLTATETGSWCSALNVACVGRKLSSDILFEFWFNFATDLNESLRSQLQVLVVLFRRCIDGRDHVLALTVTVNNPSVERKKRFTRSIEGGPTNRSFSLLAVRLWQS
jgi:hypothetical protein